MIAIRRGDSKRIDFSMPIQATNQQMDKFVEFLKTIYHESVVEEIDFLEEEQPFRTKRLGDKPRPDYPMWSSAENTKLLDVDIIDDSEIAEQIGRTPTAIYMRRGHWIARFMEWAGDRNVYENTEELVREFMDHLEEEKLKMREQRKEQRKKDKQRDKERDDLKRHLHSLEKTLKKQQEMREKLPTKSAIYDEGILKTLLDIEKTKFDLEKYDDSQ